MALELQKQNYMAPTGSTPAASSNASNASAPINIPIGQVEEEYVVDSQTQATAQPQTKRTVEELYRSISSICQANGLNVTEAKNIGLLSSISGKTEEELLNVEQNEIDQIVQKLTNAINAIKEDIDTKRHPEKLNFGLIKNYVKLLNGEVPKGWDSIESFRNAQRIIRKDGSTNAQSLAERLNAMYSCDISKLSTEELAIKLEDYFNGQFKRLSSAELSKEEVDNKQLTDFTKLLFNSSPEEYSMFRDAIEYLLVNNRCQGYKAILDSFETDAQRTEFSNETTHEQTQIWQTKPDQRNEITSVEQNSEITATAIKYKDEEHIAEYTKDATNAAKEFYTEENKEILDRIKANPEIIKNIQEKLAKGEELTAEEQKLFEVFVNDRHFRGDSAGQIIGVGINKVINNDRKPEILEIIHKNTYEIGQKAEDDFYKEVLQAIENYISENHEALTMSKEDFVSIMNEVTDGNYEELVVPVAVKEEPIENPVQSNGFGFSTRENIELPKIENIQNQIKSYAIKEDTTPRIANANRESAIVLTHRNSFNDYRLKYGAFKGFSEYAKEVGVIPALKDAFKNLNNTDKTQVKKTYKRQNITRQADLIKNSGVGSINEMLAWAKDSAIERLNGSILRTGYATKALEEKNEEIQKDKSRA